jgi:hypothetical protein
MITPATDKVLTKYADGLKGQMKSLKFDLDILKVKATEGEENKSEMTEVIFELQEKLDRFEKRLGDLTLSSPQFWPKLKLMLNNAWEDASYSIQIAKRRYLQ